MDRIAEASGCNKQAIYAYFGNKDGLFDAVYNEMVVKVISSVPMDASDLPGYAACLVEHYGKHAEVLRLASWYELEKAGHSPTPVAAERATKDKIAAISGAQKAGLVTDRIPPEHLLELILTMTRTNLHRNALIEAVGRLVRP